MCDVAGWRTCWIRLSTDEVTEEGERDKDLNEKFICYCEKNDGELAASTEELRNKIPQIEASIKEAVGLDTFSILSYAVITSYSICL